MPTTLACSISSSLKIYTYKQEEDAIVCTSKEGSNISLDPITKVVCDAQRVNESNTIQVNILLVYPEEWLDGKDCF